MASTMSKPSRARPCAAESEDVCEAAPGDRELSAEGELESRASWPAELEPCTSLALLLVVLVL